jgi:predicted dehydrogenase
MKAAVVGVGRMGKRHAEAVRGLGLDLAGICDQNPEILRQALEDLDRPAAAGFTDFNSLLETVEPDILVIATTAPTHAAYTCAAAERGVKYILCEKPMATSLADCDRMIDVCRRHGVRLAVNHQMRFMDYYREAKRVVESAEFGRLSSITVVAGNFGLAMNGSHYFEMFRYLTDQPAEQVTAWLSKEIVPNPRGPEFEDRGGSIRATNANGQRLYLEIDPEQGHGIKVIYAGRYGVLVFDELAGTMSLSVREEQYRNLPTARYGMPAVAKTLAVPPTEYETLMPRIFKSLLEGDDFPSGADGRGAVGALVAAYVSDENGHRPVLLDDQLPLERKFPWA